MKRKIVAVSYLNTKPFLKGLLHSSVVDWADVEVAIPSAVADQLRTGAADIGLVPVAAIPEIKGATIISDYCIGTNGAVETVALFSDVPLSDIKEIVLDYQSRTSAQLIQVLLKGYLNRKDIKFEKGNTGFESEMNCGKAVLVIGDRAIAQSKKAKYKYDLGALWNKYTGLPFVFAAWVSRIPLSLEQLSSFNMALKNGLSKIPIWASEFSNEIPGFDLLKYYTEHICFDLTEEKKRGLFLFMEKIGTPLAANVFGQKFIHSLEH